MCLKINRCDWMQAWAYYLLPGRANWRQFMPKNISAETNSKCIIFLLCFKSTTTGLRLVTWMETGMKQKQLLSCTHSLCDIFWWGQNTTGGEWSKKICQKNCSLETFSPRDFLKHGGHEGSGYSAVWKVLNGCLFKLQASVAAWCLGWQITHFSLKGP